VVEERTLSERPEFYGRITPESIERMRRRIGVRQPGVPAWCREAHPDTMRHFAWSFGDDNPMFGEPDYGAQTRWGSMIAAPFYYANIAQPVSDQITPDMREATRGALAGLHSFHAATEVWFYRPIFPGDRAWSAKWVSSVLEKESEFGGGQSVRREVDEFVETDSREPILRTRSLFIHTERHSSKEAGTAKSVTVPLYTADDIEAIEADILREKRRGGEHRFWEDVQVGDKLPLLTKGPLTVTDIVAGHIGRGPGHHAWGPSRLAVERRRAHPGFYTRNEAGAWDVVQRVHWDQGFAEEIGAARAYDYGSMRQNWLAHLVTDWMGDSGCLLRLRCEFRKFNYVGDVSRIEGVVTDKHDDGTIEVEISCTNQDGLSTCPGDATVRLPTRQNMNPSFLDAADWPNVFP
jgi:acyl dehydratase